MKKQATSQIAFSQDPESYHSNCILDNNVEWLPSKNTQLATMNMYNS